MQERVAPIPETPAQKLEREFYARSGFDNLHWSDYCAERIATAESALVDARRTLKFIEEHDFACECDDHANPDCCAHCDPVDCFCAHCIAGHYFAKPTPPAQSQEGK